MACGVFSLLLVPLTGVIALEMGYAGPEHRAALFAVGVVLFLY